MGYSEVMCHICGVGFNISRIRTPEEPRSAAWGNHGPLMGKSFWENPIPQQGSYVHPDGIHPLNCPRDAGCMFAIRAIKDESRNFTIKDGKVVLSKKKNKDSNDDHSDHCYEPSEEDDEEEEALEYISDDEALLLDTETQTSGLGVIESSKNKGESLTWEQVQESLFAGLFETCDGKWANEESFKRFKTEDEKFPAWYRGIPYYIKLGPKNDVLDDMFPLYRTDQPEDSLDKVQDLPWTSRRKAHKKSLGYDHKDRQYVEHIAGPGCNNLMGYSGQNIGADEMRGCQTLQCLVRKPKGQTFDPLPDDEDWEKTGEFFLSGLSDHVPSRDDNSPRVKPARHGCERPHADNYMFDENDAHDVAMPFHPSCLEVYKRASMFLSNSVDITALTSWWSLEADYRLFHGFPRDTNVRKCNEQEWTHHRGTEYLVANPIHVPKLHEIFALAIESRLDSTSRSSASNIVQPVHETVSLDSFSSLPVEIRLEIFDHLSSKDVASLRCTSREFRQLSVGYFHKLLVREWPWLWEAWPTASNPNKTMPYAKWACWTAGEVDEITKRHQQELATLDDYCRIVKKEMPELATEIDAAYETRLQDIQDAHKSELEGMEGLEPVYLPPTRTNYFALYTLIKRHWKDLRGLQNRERIWTDCKKILKRARIYKEQGRIGDSGITEELYDVVVNNLGHNP